MRYLKDGEPVNAFVGLRPCPNAKASGITEAVDSAMSNMCDNWKEKAVALGTDGAAVMVGEVGGFFALLKRDIPHLIKVNQSINQSITLLMCQFDLALYSSPIRAGLCRYC